MVQNKLTRELSKIAPHVLNKMAVTLYTGVRYTMLVRHSKAGARYSGICSDDNRIHTFHANNVAQIESVLSV